MATPVFSLFARALLTFTLVGVLAMPQPGDAGMIYNFEPQEALNPDGYSFGGTIEVHDQGVLGILEAADVIDLDFILFTPDAHEHHLTFADLTFINIGGVAITPTQLEFVAPSATSPDYSFLLGASTPLEFFGVEWYLDNDLFSPANQRVAVSYRQPRNSPLDEHSASYAVSYSTAPMVIASVNSVPEPASFALLSLATLGGIGLRFRRNRKSHSAA